MLIFGLLLLSAPFLWGAPVHDAARKGDVITVAALVDSNPAQQLNMPSPDLSTPLIEAARADRVDVVRFLLVRRADINATNVEGSSALHYAVQNRNLVLVRLLLGNGAQPNYHNKAGYTPLILAAYFGDMDIIRSLVERGADVTIPDRKGILPVTYAVNYPEVTAYLKQQMPPNN